MALSYFQIRKSIFGRLLGISSTGGLVMGVNSTGKLGSSDVSMAAQMWGPGMFQTIGAGATTTKIISAGITYISSGSTAAALYSIDPPVQGVRKQIVIQTSSTLITFNTTAVSILFQHASTLGVGSTGGGSSALTVTGTAPGIGGVNLELIGLSTTQWLVFGKSSKTSTDALVA